MCICIPCKLVVGLQADASRRVDNEPVPNRPTNTRANFRNFRVPHEYQDPLGCLAARAPGLLTVCTYMQQ